MMPISRGFRIASFECSLTREGQQPGLSAFSMNGPSEPLAKQFCSSGFRGFPPSFKSPSQERSIPKRARLGIENSGSPAYRHEVTAAVSLSFAGRENSPTSIVCVASITTLLPEAIRKAFKDPAFLDAYKKATGEDATPVMPEELQRIVKEVPRDPEVVGLFNLIAGPESLPDR